LLTIQLNASIYIRPKVKNIVETSTFIAIHYFTLVFHFHPDED